MISVVIPIHNEADSLETLHAELDRVVAAWRWVRPKSCSLTTADGRSWNVVSAGCARSSVRAIRFRRNFGKAAALTAGMRASRGDIDLTLDADLQDDPAENPADAGEAGRRLRRRQRLERRRYDPWHKVYPSRVFNWMVSRLTGCRLHDHNCGFKVYRRAVLDEVGIYGELHRFVPVSGAARGFRVGEIEVNHRARKFGASKYGVRRFIKGLLDLVTVRFLTRFGQRPLHVMGGTGLVLFFIGSLGMLALAVLWLDPANRPIGNRPLLIYSASLLIVGTQLVSLGILAELVTSYNIQAHDTYSIAETVASARPPRRAEAFRVMKKYKYDDEAAEGDEPAEIAPRSEHRRFFAQIVIGTAVAMAPGATLETPTQLEVNDISRWCTVWSLLEHGTYAIDDCPWQAKTQDKVKKPDKLAKPDATSGVLKSVEYAIAPASWKSGDPVDHFYSSKPPLLPTMIAGFLYPARKVIGVPLDKTVEQPRLPRFVQKPIEGQPGKTEYVLETPKEPALAGACVLPEADRRAAQHRADAGDAGVIRPPLGPRGRVGLGVDAQPGGGGVRNVSFCVAQTLNNHSVAAASAVFRDLRAGEDLVGGRAVGLNVAAAGFWRVHRVQRITGRHLRIAAVLPPFRPLSGEDAQGVRAVGAGADRRVLGHAIPRVRPVQAGV